MEQQIILFLRIVTVRISPPWPKKKASIQKGRQAQNEEASSSHDPEFSSVRKQKHLSLSFNEGFLTLLGREVPFMDF